VSKRDLGASVRQRLLNQAREQGRPFQQLLQYHVMERFLNRLSKLKLRNAFVLRGALLLTAWRAPQSRPTMDIVLSLTNWNCSAFNGTFMSACPRGQ
jgi:hypothetical protein